MARTRKAIYLETTEVTAERSAGEITSVLVAGGARNISTDYDAGRITGMHFTLMVNDIPFGFALPARTAVIREMLRQRRQKSMGFRAHEYDAKDDLQAERIAWRQLLRWVQIQMAMVDAGMAQSHEVFLPYLQDQRGKSVFERFEETTFKALLPAAKGA
jgi:hypothetical protein